MANNRQATIADRIEQALRIKGMRQADLCKLAKIPKSSLSQYLRGDFEPKQDRIYLIAKALNVNEAWLMGFDVPMERTKEKNYSPSEAQLTEEEQKLLESYHRLSSEIKKLLVETIDSFDSLSEDKQKLALQMLRFALGNQ